MSKPLVIVESPAKAKTIEKFLGKDYTVKSSFGHIRDLPKKGLNIDIKHNFAPTYQVSADKKKVVSELKKAATSADIIWLASDEDREGEAIAWHLAEALEIPESDRRRVTFSEITKGAILESFSHPRGINLDLVNAQQARRILDRLVGYKLSPLLSRLVAPRSSAGRVQSVALRLVVERERAIRAFVPRFYSTVELGVSPAADPELVIPASLVGPKGESLELESDVAAAAVARITGGTATVTERSESTRKQRPVPPFTTSTLQQEAGRKHGYRSRVTMQLAQKLYEGVDIGGERTGLITYMRTDSPQVAKEAQDEVRGLITEKFGAEYVPAQPPVYKTRAKGAQEAHEAIRPTSSLRLPETLRPHLTSDQYRLYSLVWKRFVASQMLGATYDTVAVDVVARPEGVAEGGSPTYTLRANGSILRFAGFLKVLDAVEGDGEEADKRSKLLPEVTVGEALALETVDGTQHFTQPPPRFSEATLIKALEEDGIGRPSTYAPILSTIQEREYVKRIERVLRPTDLGMIVNDLLVEHFPDVVDAGFTAHIEGQLDQVADGEGDWVPVVDQFYKPFAENLEKARDLMERGGDRGFGQ